MGKHQVFRDVTLVWKDESHVIPANRVMGAIFKIEEVFTLKELSDAASRRSTVRLAMVSQAYGNLLRYAGVDVEDEEVYAGMFAGQSASTEALMKAITTLLTLMIPPSTMDDAIIAAAAEQTKKNGGGGGTIEGELTPGGGASSSARRSSRRPRSGA